MSATYSCPGCGRLNRVRRDRQDSAKCGHCQAALDVSGRPIQVTDAALERLLRTSPVPVLVDFYADWCGPCRMLAPVLVELGEAHAGDLLVVKVDTERDGQHAGRLGVSGIPALFLFKEGSVVDKASGMRPLGFWQQMVAPHL